MFSQIGRSRRGRQRSMQRRVVFAVPYCSEKQLDPSWEQETIWGPAGKQKQLDLWPQHDSARSVLDWRRFPSVGTSGEAPYTNGLYSYAGDKGQGARSMQHGASRGARPRCRRFQVARRPSANCKGPTYRWAPVLRFEGEREMLCGVVHGAALWCRVQCTTAGVAPPMHPLPIETRNPQAHCPPWSSQNTSRAIS
jgi:hypothetical protein